MNEIITVDKDIKILFSIPEKHQWGGVHSTDGIASTLTATDYKDPQKVLIKKCIK